MADLYLELQRHLKVLTESPSTPVNLRLVDSCSQVLSQQLKPEETAALVKEISTLVPTLPQDPSSLNALLIALLAPFSFTEILSLSGNIDFVSGLSVDAIPYHRLLLSILEKATRQPADAATLAAQPGVISSLIVLWLSSPDPGIGQLGGDTILGLLSVDHDDGTGRGQGLVWRRIFKDHDVYALLFSLTTCSSGQSDHTLSRNQRTLAQSRLLELLPKLCRLDWDTLTKSHDTQINRTFDVVEGGGLLDYACDLMVDVKDDVLMHKCLIDFFAELISTVTERGPTSRQHSSTSLDYLRERGLHNRMLELYTYPDKGGFDVQFLYGSAATYVATYAAVYPTLITGDDMVHEILQRLEKALSRSPSAWAHQETPKHDLHVLTSLPRAVLLPNPLFQSSEPATSVLSLLPTKQTNPDVLNALSVIFHGPDRNDSLTFPEESPMMSSIDERSLVEAQHARALFYIYTSNHNPRMFYDLVTHANSVALTDVALAALNLITALATASWAPLPQTAPQGLSEAAFTALLPQPTPPLATTGVQALLSPPSLEYTLPYLLKPARSFANLVGGRGDSESVAYKVAMAKFSALRAMHDRLVSVVEAEPGQGYEEILDSLKRDMVRGAWSQGDEVGGHIATLEL